MWSKHPRVNDRLSILTESTRAQPGGHDDFDAPPAQRGSGPLLNGAPAAFDADAPSDDSRTLPRWFTSWDSRARKAALMLCAALAVVVAWWWWSGQPAQVHSAADTSLTGAGDATDIDPELGLQVASGTVLVHVVGKVADPGVVELPVGARVQDAIEAAGGATKDKALESVNLARPVVDGEQIIVGVPTEGATSSTISINTANVDQLDELPGVGPAIAGRIVQWRETNGPFTSIDQLTEVSGIGPSILEQIRELVSM